MYAWIKVLMPTDPNWITIFLFVVQFLLGVVVVLIGFVMRGIVTDLRGIAAELKQFQLHTVQNGVMRDYFETYRKETRERLHSFGDRLAAVEGAMRILHQGTLK